MKLLPGGAPRLGLGLAALGRPGYINLGRNADLADRSVGGMRARAYEVLDAAWAGGVRWFDAARSYGESECFVGAWLEERGHAPADVAVSSKWGYRYTAGWRVDTGGEPHEVKDHSLAHLEAQVPESEGLVGSYLRLYQVHSATFESGVLEDKAVHKALNELRERTGWGIGLSVSSPKQGAVIEAALSIVDQVDGRPLFDSVQATYNVFEQAPAAALQKAHDRGLTIIVKEAMANGRALRALEAPAKALGCAPDALALACVLAQPFEPHVLSGAVTAEQLASNLGALAVADRLRAEPAKLAEIMAAARMDSEEYWSERAALAWN